VGLVLYLVVLALGGCAGRDPGARERVARTLEDRTGHTLPPPSSAGSRGELPPGVALEDGLGEDEAVATALWNNPRFQADLTALGFARADLAEAGLLRNPVLSLLFPWGPKQLEATLGFPVEFLWQRPRRMAVARLGLDVVAENLVQNGPQALKLSVGRTRPDGSNNRSFP